MYVSDENQNSNSRCYRYEWVNVTIDRGLVLPWRYVPGRIPSIRR